MKRAFMSMTRHVAYAVVVCSLLAVFSPSSWGSEPGFKGAGSFSPIYLQDTGGGWQTLTWRYSINGGNPIETVQDGAVMLMSFSDLVLSIDPDAGLREGAFGVKIGGDLKGKASASFSESLEQLDDKVLVKDQAMDMTMSLKDGRVKVNIAIATLTEMSPSAEWFLDRSDLDQLPIGYVYDEQGTLAAVTNGYVDVSIPGYGSQRDYLTNEPSTSTEFWEIIGKQDSLTINGTEYRNIVVVRRSTVAPGYSLGGNATAENVDMIYWVAKGVGMVKGIGQYEFMGEPLEIELLSTNAPGMPPVAGTEWGAAAGEKLAIKGMKGSWTAPLGLCFGHDEFSGLADDGFRITTGAGLEIRGSYLCDAKGKAVLVCDADDLAAGIAAMLLDLAVTSGTSIEALHIDIVGQKIATRLKKGTLTVKMSVTFQATGRLAGEPFDSKGKWAVKATGTPD